MSGPATTQRTSSLVGDLLALRPDPRSALLATFSARDLSVVLAAARRELGTPYGLWADDPVGFRHFVLGEPTWSGQDAIARSVEANRRTVVYSTHSSGKTDQAGRLVLWWGSVHPIGTALAITTAPRARSVKAQIWPHIRVAHAKANLFGQVDVAQWWSRDGSGVRHDLAFGFSPGQFDESAVRGFKALHLLLIIDDAGDMSDTMGRAWESVTTGGHTRMLVNGNVPVDLADTWFEKTTTSENFHAIRIAATDTPNFTGEPCAPEVAANLVDQTWVDEQVREYGAESAYVTARVHARFPRGASDKVIPADWVEARILEPDDPRAQPRPGDPVALAVDIASDGGDELAIARRIGNVARIVHTSSGATNANAVDVCGKILEEIVAAEAIARELGSRRKVRVKVDVVGLGWGPVGILERWRDEQRHGAEIVAVNAGSRARKSKEYARVRPEMWYQLRDALRPEAEDDPIDREPLWLVIDAKTARQLSAPKRVTASDGRRDIERKTVMKTRGVESPDRADALAMVSYEPVRSKASLGVPGGRIPRR